MSLNTEQILEKIYANKLTESKKADKNYLRSGSQLWSGSQHSGGVQANNVIDTGHPVLNQQLHDQGWPLDCNNEICLPQHGIGELRLLLPSLRFLCERQPTKVNVLWIAPPFIPFAPALAKHNIDTSKIRVVNTQNINQTLWATEQALLSNCCAAVFSWTDKNDLSNHQLRRLQLATQKTNTWNVLLRHSECLAQASPSGLRLQLKQNSFSQLTIHITKQPFGWADQQCQLSLTPHYENWQRLPVQLLPEQNCPQVPSLRQAKSYTKAESNKQQSRTASVTLLK